MPLGDMTGPAGEGPMTGRGAGYCAGKEEPGFMNPPSETSEIGEIDNIAEMLSKVGVSDETKKSVAELVGSNDWKSAFMMLAGALSEKESVPEKEFGAEEPAPELSGVEQIAADMEDEEDEEEEEEEEPEGEEEEEEEEFEIGG